MEHENNLERLAERIDELLAVLNYVAKDLREVSEKLKAAVQTVPPQAAPEPATPLKELSVEEVASAFPEDLQKLLKFEDKDEFIAVKPVGYLGPDNFAKVADIVRNRFGGEYMSAGKDSHFLVRKRR